MEKNRPMFILMLLIAAPLILILLSDKKCWSGSSITARENLDILMRTNSCRDCDLSGLNLNRMDLSGADLQGADLSLTKLFLVNLSQANLKNAKLNGAVFGGADLGDADLRGADLRGANLEGAYLTGALIDGKFITATPYADAGVPDLQKEIYIADPARSKKTPKKKDIQLAKPRILTDPPPSPFLQAEQSVKETVVEKDPVPADTSVVEQMYAMPKSPQSKTLTAIAPLTINRLSKRSKAPQREMFDQKTDRTAVLDNDDGAGSQAQVVEIVPVVSDIIPKPLPTISIIDLGSSFAKKGQSNLLNLKKNNSCYACDLSGIDLSGENLKDVDLERANLSGANFQGAVMHGANLKGTNCQDANFRGAQLREADFYKADLSGADFTGADISAAKFEEVDTADALGLDGVAGSLKP